MARKARKLLRALFRVIAGNKTAPANPGAIDPVACPDAHAVKAMTDDQLLDLVQKQTLRYFWDFADPDTGMIRERSNGPEIYGHDVVTTGATGFGIMALIAGCRRGWLERPQILQRIQKITDFLENADSWHGAFPHFLDSHTGKAGAFSAQDDGADLVETSFLMMGLLTARQYFDNDNPQETALREKIDSLWEAVDWQFFTRGRDQLYWHWSPRHGWAMDLPIRGWNECLLTYILATASPTHPVDKSVYEKGWARNGAFQNGQTYEGVRLPLGPEKGGPLFFAHYSFMGLDPRGLKDKHADYLSQNTAHTLVNYVHCVANPYGHKGYGADCWGLTASDDPNGYAVHEPQYDNGVITPTAALSSLPYTPDHSIRALRHFLGTYGDKLWGEYGFKDAFSPAKDWYADSYLGIDQAPIVVMIENYRSGLLWDLFMSCPEVQQALNKLDFRSPYLGGTCPENDQGSTPHFSP